MKRIKREDEKGAMGIGTLIIFIAMVLVAAVAASVLISTAYDLQQQAQKTGDEAIREVSTSYVVKDVIGRDSDGDGNINSIELKVGLAAGAPDQDFNQTVIQVDNGSAQDDLKAVSTWSGGTSAAAGAGEYAIEPLIEQSTGDYGILETGDTVNITIPTDGTNNLGQLTPQTDMSIRIIPKHGTPTLETFSTPPVIKDTIIHLA